MLHKGSAASQHRSHLQNETPPAQLPEFRQFEMRESPRTTSSRSQSLGALGRSARARCRADVHVSRGGPVKDKAQAT